MVKNLFIGVFAAAAACFAAQAALAHPRLVETAPSADTQAQSPREIRLTFSEALVGRFSGLGLKDQDGKQVETGPAAASPQDKKQLIVPLKSLLAPGRYTVEWHAVSEDTHRIKGSYSFEVTP